MTYTLQVSVCNIGIVKIFQSFKGIRKLMGA